MVSDDELSSESFVTSYGFIEKIRIADDICPTHIRIVQSSRQFIVYTNFKETWGPEKKEKSIYSFEYIRNFERNIGKLEMEAIHGEVTVKGYFIEDL